MMAGARRGWQGVIEEGCKSQALSMRMHLLLSSSAVHVGAPGQHLASSCWLPGNQEARNALRRAS